MSEKRSVSLTKEEAAVIRVALATSEIKDNLTEEGTAVLKTAIMKIAVLLTEFPADEEGDR